MRRPILIRWGFPALVLAVLSLALFWMPSPSPAQPAGWKAYFGNLHSHSEVSDGVESPDVAFAFARDQAKVDFLCLSEHNHMSSPQGLAGVVKAGAEASSAKFVGLTGQEYSTLPPNGGNHANVYDVVEPIPAELNNNYRELYQTFLPNYAKTHPQAIIVAQFNHPQNIDRDYGAARVGPFPNYDGDLNGFVAGTAPWVRLIAILSGPADSNMAKAKKPPLDVHRDVDDRLVRIWHRYLDRGLRLGPVADQDNHRQSWGARTTARTGVWIQGALGRESLLRALQESRTFATEDKDLRVWFSIDDLPMGSRLAVAADASHTVKIMVSDDSEPNSSYNVELLRDVVGDGELPIRVQNGKIKNGATLQFSIEGSGQHELFLVHVEQIVEQGDEDDAWTAPIWISPSGEPGEHSNPPPVPVTAQFVGSKNSDVYHFPECKVVATIRPENLVQFTSAPAGKRRHKNCPQE